MDYSRQRNGKHYYAVIGYTYSVMGARYDGSIRKDEILGTKGSAEKNIALHPEGSSFNVRYNPINPELHAVDFDNVSSYEIFNAILFSIIGLILLVLSRFVLLGK